MIVGEDERTRREVAEAMGRAAAAWLDTLDGAQRASASWPGPGSLDSETERVRWFYTPTDHGGLPLNGQRPHQQQAVMQLLAQTLSPAGYVTLSTVLGWENVLDLVESFGVSWARERGRDPGMYYLRIFGDPGRDNVWGWRFGGHHVSVNLLVANGDVRGVTPFFLGADPAAGPALGAGELRPLGAMEDLAGNLIRSLDPEQRARAVLLDRAPADIIGGNRSRLGEGDRMIALNDVWRGHFADETLATRLRSVSDAAEASSGFDAADHDRLSLTTVAKGISARDLGPAQRESLSRVVASYTERVAPALAPEVDLDSVHLAWAGSTDPRQPHYYRMQAPRFLAEWDNTQRGGNHAHSVWRDPVGDFGLDLLQQHLGGLS